jgi:predicted DNA-binding transcriptional regulator YafY
MNSDQQVAIEYVNYRGEKSARLITPIRVHFGSSEWHPEPQWLLGAYDHGKAATRDFAMKDIMAWVPTDPRNRANCAVQQNSLSDGSGDGT